MKLKKISFILFIGLVIIAISGLSLADDYLENETLVLNMENAISVSSSLTPSINSRHAVVFDRASKNVIFGKNENETCKMASTTKILTAIIVIEKCSNLNEIVTISEKSARNRWL